MYHINQSGQFKRDIKSFKHKPHIIEILKKVVILLAQGHPLDSSYRDHELSGFLKGKRECHIKPDILLVYEINDDILLLTLLRFGNHNTAFKK